MTLAENKEATYHGESFIGFWGEITKETEKAFLVKTECKNLYDEESIAWDRTKDVEFWIPKSAVKDTVLHRHGRLIMFLVEIWMENKLVKEVIDQYGKVEKYALVPAYYNNLESFKIF